VNIGNIVTGVLPNETGTPKTSHQLKLKAKGAANSIPAYGDHLITVTYTLKDGGC